MAVTQKPRCFIFGIDGGTFDIIDPLVAQGRLPTLAALMREGASARTACTWPPHTGPGWASFVSAGLPGYHGIYQFFDTQDRAYRARIVGSGDFGCPTAWDCFSAAGWTLGLVNIPMSHPQRRLPGYQITWPLSNTLRYCEPPSLLAELAQAGAHFLSDLATMYRGEPDYIDRALRNIDQRVRSLKFLLENHPTDLVMAVLTEVDRVCHHYWHYRDPSHPKYVEGPPAYANAIERIHQAVDDALAELLPLLPDDCAVVVASDHGFGPGRESFAVQRWLEQAGWLTTHAAEPGGGAPLASWFSQGGRQIDWARTRLYMPVPGCYGINVNLKGRQQCGTVSPQDFDSVVDEAIALLADVRLPSTSTRAFARVVRREHAYSGPWAPKSPDILMVPADEALMVNGALDGPLWSWSYQTGLHRYEGMWIHRSPRVAAGRLSQRIGLIDLLPTALADAGVDPLASMPGTAVHSVFSSPDGGRCGPAGSGPHVASDADLETEILTVRLRELGYL